MQIDHTNIVYNYDDAFLNTDDNKNDTTGTEEDDTNDDLYEQNLINHIISKTKTQIVNRGWNSNNEKLVSSIANDSYKYKLMHENLAEKSKLIYDIIKIVLIILSCLLSALTSVPESFIQNNVYIVIVRYILTYIVTVLCVLMHFLQYSNLSIQHLQASTEFSKIHNDIEQQMCLYRKDRFLAIGYLSKISNKFNLLKKNSPIIDKHTKQKFENTKQEISVITEKQDSPKHIPKLDSVIQLLTINENDISSDTNGNTSNETNNDSTDSNCYEIEGDITDNELNICKPKNIKELKSQFLNENFLYEYIRFLNNEEDK